VADNQTTGEESVENLQAQLADKRQELASLRAERQQQAVKSQEAIQAAQLKKEIASVEAEIAVERQQLENQKKQDPALIGAGPAPAVSEFTVAPPEAPPAPEPNKKNGEGE
jgi:ribosomal protein L29